MEKIVGKEVSLPEHAEYGKTLRRVSIKDQYFTSEGPKTTKRLIRNKELIFNLATDGLVQRCLDVLMQTFDCQERTVIATREVIDDFMYPANNYTYCTHRLLVYQNRSAPYLVTDLKVKTTWLAVGGQPWFRSGLIKSQEPKPYSEYFSTTLPVDATVRKQIQEEPYIDFEIIP